MVLKSINKHIQTETIIMTTCYCTSNTIYDKHIDVMANKAHLISIFMNIIEMSKIGAKPREKLLSLKRFLVRYMIILAF